MADSTGSAASSPRQGSSELDRLRALVEPIAADLDLEVYDVERRGATIRVTIDTPPGSDGGVTLDNLSLATRLISREIDHEDPISGRFTLEVSSPGLERQLKTPAHFQREVGKTISIRLRDPKADPRRIQGHLRAADDDTVTVVMEDGSERVFDHAEIDKARTVFVWGPKPKPGGPKSSKNKKNSSTRPHQGDGPVGAGSNSDTDKETEMETQTS